jgi:hypothetical protein
MRALLATLCVTVLAGGCHQPSCLGGTDDCRVASPCQGLSFACPSGTLEIRQLDAASVRPGGYRALGGAGDVLLANDQMVAVVSGLGNQTYLDVGGGSLIDLSTRGQDNDALSAIFQVVGVLPEDSAHYDTLEILDERPVRVAVQLRGTLYHRPDRPIYTVYELRACEPGIRVRTEIYNGSPETHLWTLSDGYYWSGRSLLPFTPADGQGFDHPSFDLLTIDDAFRAAPFLAASTHDSATATSYATVACNATLMSGFHSSVVSSGGLPKTVVPARGTQVFERFITVAARPDVAGAADQAFEIRRQLFGDEYTTLSGRVDGASGKERDVSLLVVEKRDEARIPWTQVVPGSDGRFSARVPRERELVIEVWAAGRKTAEIAVPAGAGEVGTLPLMPRQQVAVEVTVGGVPIDAEVYVVPADDATREAARGTLHGQLDNCSPWLGPPPGASPACNRVLVSRLAPARFTLPAGSFHLYAYHGPFHSLARVTVDTTQSMSPDPISLPLVALPLRPPGTVSADLHVHGASSFDSSIPDADRVLSFAAADLDVLIATDHDVVGSYADVVTALGLQDRVTAVSGVETTGHVPYLSVPGDAFPRVIGHYNFWPLAYRPGSPRNGGPFDEFVEPGELFNRVEPLFVADGVRQLNHPWAASEFGRDLGFPRAIHLNLLAPLPAVDDGTNQGMYVRRHGRFGNGDHDTQEVMNGSANDAYLQYRAFWFYLLDQGIVRTGTANSDSHSLTDNTVGAPRNLVYTSTQAGSAFNVAEFNRALKSGAVIGSNGPVIEASISDSASDRTFGLTPFRPGAGAQLKLTVSAAPWVVVDEIRIVVNGQVVRTLDGLPEPADRFGTTGLVRFTGVLPLADLLPPSGDAWLVIEAGTRLPLAADLGGGLNNARDGVPDTGDNNKDGVVDERDIAAGEDYGPIAATPEPARTDPRYHFFQVVPGGLPCAFTNPFVLDRDGNGRFDGPGVRR